MSTPEQDAEELEYIRTYMAELTLTELAARLRGEGVMVSAEELRAMEQGRVPIPRELIDTAYAIVSDMHDRGEIR